MPAPRPRVPFLPQEPLLYKCFSDLCLHRCIHSDNCYLLNYLLLAEERQNKWLSRPCSRPPGSLCLEATPAGGAWVKQGPASLAPGTRARGAGQGAATAAATGPWAAPHRPRPRRQLVCVPSVLGGLGGRTAWPPPPSDTGTWSSARVTA